MNFKCKLYVEMCKEKTFSVAALKLSECFVVRMTQFEKISEASPPPNGFIGLRLDTIEISS